MQLYEFSEKSQTRNQLMLKDYHLNKFLGRRVQDSPCVSIKRNGQIYLGEEGQISYLIFGYESCESLEQKLAQRCNSEKGKKFYSEKEILFLIWELIKCFIELRKYNLYLNGLNLNKICWCNKTKRFKLRGLESCEYYFKESKKEEGFEVRNENYCLPAYLRKLNKDGKKYFYDLDYTDRFALGSCLLIIKYLIANEDGV